MAPAPVVPPRLPASSYFNKYSLLKMKHGMVALHFVIDPRLPRTGKAAPWEGTLTIRCPDVPRLMREGLFWSEDNIVPNEFFMEPAGPKGRAAGYSHIRSWVLADKSESEGGDGIPKWVACLEVAASANNVLAAFRPQDLTRAHIWKANAWNVYGQTIYNYDSYAPANNYNCILDDTPLRGWWPWPRGEDGE